MNLVKKVSLVLSFFVFFALSPHVNAATSPNLGTANSYSVLAGSEVTNTGATTIGGNVGISPGIGSPPHYSGFGTVTMGGSIHDADGAALTAQADRSTAFTALGSQSCDVTYAGTKDLVGSNLIPGVYCADAFELTGTLTLNGSASDVWIFKSASSLVITGSTANVVFTGGGQPCNVWWRVVSTATFTPASVFSGNVLAATSITFGAGSTLNGKALAGTAAVTLDSTSITGPTCVAGTSSSGSTTGSGGSSTTTTPGLPNTGQDSEKKTKTSLIWGIAGTSVVIISVAFILRKKHSSV